MVKVKGHNRTLPSGKKVRVKPHERLYENIKRKKIIQEEKMKEMKEMIIFGKKEFPGETFYYLKDSKKNKF